MKQTFRIILTVLAVFLLVTLLTGCQKQSKTEELDGHGKRFVVIEEYSSYTDPCPYRIVVDMETGVEYVKFTSSASVLLDSYGNPIIYPAFDAREDRLP